MPIARPVRAARRALAFALSVAGAFSVAALALPVPAVAQTAAAATAPAYAFREAMISTRDGVKLYTPMFAPTDQREPLPFMFIRP